MASNIWTALRKRVAPDEDRAPAAVEPVSQPSLGLRLTGDLQLLDRPVVVRPDTVAIIFSDGAPPRLALPGERLRPRLLPNTDPLDVLVVNTAPVTLDVSIAKLTTLDGFDIERTTVRLSVQLAADEDFAAVTELAAEFGTDLETHLLHAVERDVVGGVQGAVRMNRLADVRRLTLQGLLTDRWLPPTFAGGTLVRRDLTVLGMVWPAEASPPGSGRSAREPSVEAEGDRRDPRGSATEVSWHHDEGLLKAWQQQLDSDVRGIAGATVGAESTVIVVPRTELGAEESTRAREIFARHFEDRRVHVVVAVAETYDDLVRTWFKQVDGSPGRLVSVEARDPGVLRITVDQSLASREERQKGLSIGTRSDREALRRLVPQERVVFVAADSAG